MKYSIITCFSLIAIMIFNNPVYSQNGLDFDGTNDYVDCGTDTSIDIGGEAITLEAMIYATRWKSSASAGHIITKTFSSQRPVYQYGYQLYAGQNGRLGFSIGSGDEYWTDLISRNSVLSLNTWHHVAGVYDGNQMKLYVDGKLTDSLNAKVGIAKIRTEPLLIGTMSGTGSYWEGRIDEVRVWNKAVSAAQIDRYADREYCEADSFLRAYYKLNQGRVGNVNSTVGSAKDFSFYGNTGNLRNFALRGTSSNWALGANLFKEATVVYDTVVACGRYQGPSKKYTWQSSGQYRDTIPTYFDCDSVILIQLTINPNYEQTWNVAVCDSFVGPKGDRIYRSSGTFVETFSTIKGCDSLITINLKVGVDPVDVDVEVCDAYTLPHSGLVVTQSGNYQDIIPSHLGCDSMIRYSVEILPSSRVSESRNMCRSLLSPSGRYTYSASGTYYDTLVNQFGCDSIIQLNVNDLSSSARWEISSCEQYVLPSGRRTLTVSGIYSDTIVNREGCDSILEIELTILSPTSSSLQLRGCGSVTAPSGNYVFQSAGTYFDTIPNASGCDSIITLDVQIDQVNSKVQRDGNTLVALTQNGAFRWLDCDRNLEPVTGATSNRFQPQNSGRFALEVTNGTCVDTSECLSATGMSVLSLHKYRGLSIYPSPNQGVFTLLSTFDLDNYMLVLHDINGRALKSWKGEGKEMYFDENLVSGTYFMFIVGESMSTHLLFVVGP